MKIDHAHADCVCRACGCKFDKEMIRNEYLCAFVCIDCNQYLCPQCKSHDVYDIVDRVIMVPVEYARAVRASVWGRGH